MVDHLVVHGPLTAGRSEHIAAIHAPIETITLDIEIDALADAQPLAVSAGIAPQLAALELLAYPKSTDVLQRQKLVAGGTLEVAPVAAPD